MNGKFELDQFSTTKIKFLAEGGLHIEYAVDLQTDMAKVSQSYEAPGQIAEPEICNQLEKLIPIVLRDIGLARVSQSIREAIIENLVQGSAGTKNTILKIVDDVECAQHAHIKITGLRISGEGKKTGINVTFKLRGISGQVAGHSTSRVMIGTSEDPVDTSEMEFVARNIVNRLQELTYDYVVNQRTAQMDLFSNAQIEDEGDPFSDEDLDEDAFEPVELVYAHDESGEDQVDELAEPGPEPEPQPKRNRKTKATQGHQQQ